MSKRIGPGPGGIRIGRLALCAAAALGTAAASWVNPPPVSQAPAAAHVPRPAPMPRAGTAPAETGRSDSGVARPPLAVTQWGFRSGNGGDIAASGHVPAGRPLTLWFELDGNQAALDQMRTRGSIAIEVHWERQTGDAAPGAPDLVTRLSIGHSGLADRLAAEVRRTGFFQWHGWAQKTSLSAGTWSVSLTYPDGQPLACGNPPVPCRFHITVG
jgi:hypothetical protein